MGKITELKSILENDKENSPEVLRLKKELIKLMDKYKDFKNHPSHPKYKEMKDQYEKDKAKRHEIAKKLDQLTGRGK